MRRWWKSIEKLFKDFSFYGKRYSLFFWVIKEAQVEAAERNQDLTDNTSLGKKSSKMLSEIADLYNNNRTEFTPMMDRNYSICC